MAFPAYARIEQMSALERSVYMNDLAAIKRIVADGPVPDESALPFCLLYLLYEGAHNFELESGNFIETARFLIARGATQSRRKNDATPYEHFARLFAKPARQFYLNCAYDDDVLALFSN